MNLSFYGSMTDLVMVGIQVRYPSALSAQILRFDHFYLSKYNYNDLKKTRETNISNMYIHAYVLGIYLDFVSMQ